MNKVIGISGLKSAGKTFYVSLIIKLLVKKGYKVGSIKHAHHDFDIDKPGTDSFKHRDAGSSQVIISSSRRWAKITENNEENEKSLDELIQEFHNVDIIVVEGFKKERHPKIVIFSKNIKNKYNTINNVIAFVSDDLIDTDTLVFQKNDIENLVEFIIKKIL